MFSGLTLLRRRDVDGRPDEDDEPVEDLVMRVGGLRFFVTELSAWSPPVA